MNQALQFSTLNYVIVFVYLGAMFAIGLSLAGKQRNFLAGQRMPWIVVAMSMFASLWSAISYIGGPGLVYAENISLIVGGFVGIMVAPLLILLYYPFYRRLNVTTSYEYIRARYGTAARYVVSGLFLLARLGWLGAVIYAPALALAVVTGINIWLSIILMGVLATTYTVLGGLSAVLWTDVAQFVILVGGAIWIAVTLLVGVPGGFDNIWSIAGATNHLPAFNWRLNLGEMTLASAAIMYFVSFMGEWGIDQVSIQRLMAIKDFRGMARAAITNSFILMFNEALLILIGLGLFAYYYSFPERLAEGIGQDKVLPYYVIQALPNGVSGLLITAIFAAAMSSMDSGINSMATVIVNDFVRPLRRKVATDAQDLRLARILTFVLGAFAVGVACYVSTIEGVLKACATFAGLFTGPVIAMFLLGVTTRRTNFAGWVVGAVVAVLVVFWIQNFTEVHFYYYVPFSFGITLVVGYLASSLLGLLLRLPLAENQYTLWGGRGKPTLTENSK